MKHCTNCGKSINELSKFCPSCGSSIEQNEQKEDIKFCPNCGEPAKDTYCQHCGALVNAHNGNQKNVENVNKESGNISAKKFAKKKIIFSLVGVLAIIVLGAVVCKKIILLFSWI